MDAIFLIPLLILLAILIGAILGFISFGRTNTLREEVARLNARIAALETGLPTPASAVAHDDVAREAGPAPVEPDAPTPPQEEPATARTGADDADELMNAGDPAPGTADEAGISPASSTPAGATSPAWSGATSAAAPRKRDLEETIGTRWAVWVGGLALGLGGIFMVRYSIEAGIIGPAARIALGLLFAAVLLGAGEWLRRSGLAEPADERGRGAYVPGVITAAGIVAAFASVYAAYALYGFLDPPVAFVGLGVVAFGALALAIPHGPGIAGLGLAASYATPLLVSSNEPAFGPLTVYLLLVAAATFAVARIRRWRWLAVVAALGSVLWSLLMIVGSSWSGGDAVVTAIYIALSFAFAAFVFGPSIHPNRPGLVAPSDRTAVAVLASFALPVLFHLAWNAASDSSVFLLVTVSTALVSLAYAMPALRFAALAAVAMLPLGYAGFEVVGAYAVTDPVTGAFAPAGLAELMNADLSRRTIGAGVMMGLLFAALGFFGTLGSAARTVLAVTGSAIPLGLTLVAYLRTADFAVSPLFGLVALALAAFFAAATEALARRLTPGEHGVDGAIAVYAVATIAAIGAAMAALLERGFLTIALALLVPAIAWVEAARPVRGLRATAAAASAVVAARFVFDPAVVGTDLGTTPIFNWLLYGYGVPALGFAFAAWRFGRTRMDGWVPVFEALAVVFTTLTAVMLIHHGMNGGAIFTGVSGLAEQSLIASAMLAVSLGMQWMAVRRASPVFAQGTLVVGALGMVMALVGLAVVQNPMATGEAIDGGTFDGTLILGYLLPAILAFAVAALAAIRADRPGWYVRSAGGLGGILAALWVTLAVRATWHAGDLGAPPIEEGELYAYSAVWLAAGLVVLGVGVALRSRAIRMVSTALVIAVVAKVFLIDTAGLTGALRALSFIGLGAVLVVVGLAYQKLLRRRA